MATTISIKELRNMPLDDLRRECNTHRQMVAKMHLQIEMQKEKDTAKYRREKKVLARMETVLTEKTPKKPTNPKKPTSSVSSVPSDSSESSSSALSKPKKPSKLPVS